MREIEVSAARQVERMGHTSKGDQPKWQIGYLWYKADHMGYESLAEIVASRLMEKSNIDNFVRYEPVRIIIDGKSFPGCVSRNFRGKQESLIPLERLHRAYKGEGLSKAIAGLPEVEARLRYTVDFVKAVTNMEGFDRYLSTLLELDAFLLNEDRHTNNLAVLRDDETKAFRFCPLFDHGLSLLSDTGDYPLNEDVYTCIDRVKAKPFSTDFTEQAEVASTLYGTRLHFNCGTGDIPALLDGLDELYDGAILLRAEKVLREQMRKYRYLF